jgi:hypothetical protein
MIPNISDSSKGIDYSAANFRLFPRTESDFSYSRTFKITLRTVINSTHVDE